MNFYTCISTRYSWILNTIYLYTHGSNFVVPCRVRCKHYTPRINYCYQSGMRACSRFRKEVSSLFLFYTPTQITRTYNIRFFSFGYKKKKKTKNILYIYLYIKLKCVWKGNFSCDDRGTIVLINNNTALYYATTNRHNGAIFIRRRMTIIGTTLNTVTPIILLP